MPDRPVVSAPTDETARELVEAATAYVDAVNQEWIRYADPSDPDEDVPPWQENSLLGRLCRAAAPFARREARDDG